MAFDRAGATGQREADGDGVLVAAPAGDEGVQLGQVVVQNGGHPCFETVAAAVGHHLREVADVSAERGQLRGVRA